MRVQMLKNNKKSNNNNKKMNNDRFMAGHQFMGYLHIDYVNKLWTLQ